MYRVTKKNPQSSVILSTQEADSDNEKEGGLMDIASVITQADGGVARKRKIVYRKACLCLWTAGQWHGVYA